MYFATPFLLFPGFMIFAPIESFEIKFLIVVIFFVWVALRYMVLKKCPKCSKPMHYMSWAGDPFRKTCMNCGAKIPSVIVVLKSCEEK